VNRQIRFGWLLALTCLIAGGRLQAGEIGWIESFSLGADREAALKQLIPGTEDYYYFHCLHYQNTEQWAKCEAMLKTWVEKQNHWTPRAIEIQNRQALLTYSANPDGTLALLRGRLNLQFNHQREQLNQKPNLPTALDAALLARERLMQDALNRHPNTLQGFEDAALDWLVTADLNPLQRRQLLSRLQRPDYPRLPELIVADLKHSNSGGFGQFEIHRRLLLSQLDELLKLQPDLRNQQHFVETYLARLQPTNDANFQQDQAVQRAYVARMWEFVKTLAPVHNSLKAQVLYHWLVLDRKQGKYDKERFLEYLKLPKNVAYINPKYMEPVERRQFACDLEQQFPGTLLPPVRNDEPLVRSYLAHFFVEAENFTDFAPYVNDVYLKHLFAETKIVNGLGEAEKWAAMLPPALYQQLKQRIDLDFAFENNELFGTDEAVSLDLYVKHVDTLIVKVFEINARNFYQQNLREIDTDINLDGLVARDQKTYKYEEPAVRRVRRHFDFPTLDKRGVYVIDFIGNGKASRALVRKGKLRLINRTSVAGQIFTVFDELKRPVPQATLWLAGTLFKPNEQGEIVVPFTNQPGRQPVVINDGGFSSLQFFVQEAEEYRLTAGFYVDREELLARRKAAVLVRPQLWLGGTVVTHKVLEEVRLSITSTDLDGVVTTKEVNDFKLYDDRESTCEFQTPQRLANIRFALLAKVKVQSQNKDVPLSAEQNFSLNEIDRTDKTEDLHFARIGENYVVDLLGKTGEAKPDRAIHLVLKLRDYTEPVQATLKTDERGRVLLGSLPGVVKVTASSPQGVSQEWPIREESHTYPGAVHGDTQTAIQVPLMPTGDQPNRVTVSLLELRGDQFAADRFENASLDGGILKLTKLPPGDYSLLLKPSSTEIRVRVTEGPLRKSYVFGDSRALELRNTTPLQVLPVEVSEKSLTIKLQNAGKFARVHVFATRFEPPYSAYQLLKHGATSPSLFEMRKPASQYIAGRDIGDEYRYIIDRRFAKKFPGNMLERPGLILNPWAIRTTETAVQDIEGGAAFGGVGSAASERRSGGGQAGGGAAAPGEFSNLDFLAESSLVMANLAADENGVVEIKRDDLGPHQQLVILAIDPQNTASRYVALPDAKNAYLDLRLAKSLDPKLHFMQQKQISVLRAGEQLTINDITSTRFEMYDTLARVYALYAALGGDAKLAEFSFVRNWHTLKDDRKEELYKQYASHELHFFLAKKDPEFFAKTVKKYLANKKDPQFVDRWLLQQELNSFGRSWAFEQLNTFERILLGQRLGEQGVTARLVREQFELLPPDPDRFAHLFETALKGSALDADDKLGLSLARQEQAPPPALEEALVMDAPAESDAFDEAGGGKAPAAASRPQARERGAVGRDKKMDAANRQVEKLRKNNEYRFKESKDAEGRVDEDGAVAFFADDTSKLGTVAQFYRKLDKTMEWVESNYYHLPIVEQVPALIAVNEFWKDLSAHDPQQPFLATSMAEPTHNFHEMLMAISLLDLPFEAKEHKTEFVGVKMTLSAASPMIVYHEEIQQADKVAENTPILVSQNFFRHGDRHRMVNGEQVDKFVTDEFLVDVVYGCHLVVTNPTSSRKKVEVLLQVPTGALPVQNGQFTRSVHMDLQPYHTNTLEYFFYFPLPGKFAHYPVQVSDREQVLAFAAPFEFNVVRELTNIDKQSWDYISQHGSEEDVLNFLKTENVLAVNLDRIAWRMQDKAFFKTVTTLLAARHIYNHTLWSYGIKHDDPSAIRQYLQFAQEFVAQCGEWLDSPLLKIDPVVRKLYEFMEYRPLVNARVGQLGREREILNDRFYEQYQRLMKILSYRAALNDEELLAVTYYLLLQDRVAEAIEFFDRVDADKLRETLQYDYCAAYIGFSRGEPAKSKQIAAKYADYPVERWRELFANVVNQADEIERPEARVADDEDRTQVQTAQAARSPSLDFSLEGKQVRLDFQNLRSVTVNYYLMDIELLFSRNPFVQGESKQFENIVPNVVEVVDLPEKGNRHTFAIPPQLAGGNVLVEIVGGGVTRSQAYFSNELRVQLMENYGQLRVTQGEANAPLSTVYVKVYARTKDGNVQFYKDGYTDLRGRFDYSSLSTNELDNVEKFALLIMSDEHGAVIREANPPKQ
jgi:hypothetical protein